MESTLQHPESKPSGTAKPVPITVAYGDGIGPEIMEATLSILKAAGARLEIDQIEIGEKSTSPAILPVSIKIHGTASAVPKYF